MIKNKKKNLFALKIFSTIFILFFILITAGEALAVIGGDPTISASGGTPSIDVTKPPGAQVAAPKDAPKAAPDTTKVVTGATASPLYWVPNVGIGKFVQGKAIQVGAGANILGDYISIWYTFLVGVAGLLAMVMIVMGGITWLTSGGSSGTIGDAKKTISSALIGLTLALLSYVLLQVINPNLTTIKMPDMTNIEFTGDYQIADVPGWSMGGSGTGAPCVGNTMVGKYDFAGYAENCDHVNKLNEYNDKMKGQVNNADDAQKYINLFSKNSPITGAMVDAAATKYGVDRSVIIAEMIQDSTIASNGKDDWAVRTNNPGNLSNYGKPNDGLQTMTTRNENEHFTQSTQRVGTRTTYSTRTYDSLTDGVNGIALWISKHERK